jgi:superfamily II DNA/RNA helicase
MTKKQAVASPEALFGFAVRARILLIGRDNILRARGRLHFVLITGDLSANSRDEILEDFRHYPVVACYTSAELEKLLGVRNTKVVGFKKSTLAQSIYLALKEHRINSPA